MTPPEHILGFTGTQQGLAAPQQQKLAELILLYRMKRPRLVVHHGMCVGADETFNVIARRNGIHVVGHPGLDTAGRSPHRMTGEVDELWEAKPYLERNRILVNLSDQLLACPSGPERTRSGTWSTVRYARKTGCPILIIRPDGTAEVDQ